MEKDNDNSLFQLEEEQPKRKRGGTRSPNAGAKKLDPEYRKKTVMLWILPETERKLELLSDQMGLSKSEVYERIINAMFYLMYDDGKQPMRTVRRGTKRVEVDPLAPPKPKKKRGPKPKSEKGT